MLLLNENPWMGLASYDVADSHLFFGRETEILNLEIAIKKNLSTVKFCSNCGERLEVEDEVKSNYFY